MSRCLVSVFLLAGLVAPSWTEEKPADLPAFIQEKLKVGEKRIVIPPGTYRSDRSRRPV